MGARRDKLNASGSTYHTVNVSEWPPELVDKLAEAVKSAKPNTSLDIILAGFASDNHIPYDQVRGKWDQVRAEHERLHQMETEIKRKAAEYKKSLAESNRKQIPWQDWEFAAVEYYQSLHPNASGYQVAAWFAELAPYRTPAAVRTKIRDVTATRAKAEAINAAVSAAAEIQRGNREVAAVVTPFAVKPQPQRVAETVSASLPEDRYPSMTVLRGCPIYSIGERGVFVRLPNNTTCFVHLSELAEEYVDSPSNFAEYGQLVDVMILDYDSYGRPKASIKRVKPLPRRDNEQQLSAVPRIINTGKFYNPEQQAAQPVAPKATPPAATSGVASTVTAPVATAKVEVAKEEPKKAEPAPTPAADAAKEAADTAALPSDTTRILLALAVLVEDGFRVLEDIEMLRSAIKDSGGSARDLLKKLSGNK